MKSADSVWLWLPALFIVVAMGVIHGLQEQQIKLTSLAEIREFLLPKSIYARTGIKMDMAIFGLTLFFVGPLFSPIFSILAIWGGAEAISGLFGPGPKLISDPYIQIAVQFVAIFLLDDFWFFLSHYLAHKHPILWSGHKAHHSAESLNIFVARRGSVVEGLMFAPLGMVFMGTFSGIIFYFTGGVHDPAIPVALVLLKKVIFLVIALYQHIHIPISFGKLEYIFISPAMHQIHHSAEDHHWDRNFGGVFSVFDWIFGTAYRPAEDEQFRYGLNEQQLGQNNPHRTLLRFYTEPFIFAWMETWALIRRLLRMEESAKAAGE